MGINRKIYTANLITELIESRVGGLNIAHSRKSRPKK
jgi:hypothetical protein